MGNCLASSESSRRCEVYVDRWNMKSISQPLPTHNLRITDKSKNIGRPCIIFYNGTFAPIHYGHINALCSAKQYLQENGFNVIGAYISPCWNGYCSAKMRRKNEMYISHYHRLNMINLAIKNINYVMIDTNECFADKFYYPTFTILQFYNRILQETKLKKGEFDIIWLHGIDLGIARIPETHKTFLRTIIINNRMEDDQRTKNIENRIKNMLEKKDENKVDEDPYNLPKQMYSKCNSLQLSSTDIRDLCMKGKHNELIQLFRKYNMEEVAKYIINHKIYSSTDHDEKNEKEEDENNNNNNELINKFQQYLIENGLSNLGKLDTILTPETLTQYLRNTKYLKSNENILSYSYIKSGQNGFRGTAFRLYDFKISKDDEKIEYDKEWKFFLKMSSQITSRTDQWFTKNEYMFYKYLYPSYSKSFCNLIPLIFCDYMHSKEREINIILTQDLSETVSFPFWFEKVSDNHLILIIRSLAEFHAKSFHGYPLDEGNKNILSFTDDKYIKWVQSAALCGKRMFKSAHKTFQDITSKQIEFISMVSDNIEDILCNELYNLCKEINFMCLIHGDAVISNILLPINNNNDDIDEEEKYGIIPWNFKMNNIKRCIFVDWQTYHIGCPYFDLISLFDLLLIESESELQHKLFICYMQYLQRFGVDLKGLTNLTNVNDMLIYYKMFKYCDIWAFCVESGFLSGKFFTKSTPISSVKDEKLKLTMKIQQCVKKRLNTMMTFYHETAQST